MGSSVYELAILLSLRDVASGGLDRFEGKLRAMGKEGKAALKDFEDLRAGLKRDLAIGGVGITGLAMLKKGVDVAGAYEASLLDLKSAYQEVAAAGGMSSAEQAANLSQLEQLAVSLGNRLQGDTSQYVQILASLKKAGVDVKTVLGGAGEAAANLANVSGALTRGTANEQAKELGQFGKMFKLDSSEFGKSVDLFSALKDRFDVESSSLIESAKYFQATAGSLKITGFEGASETVKMFALLKRQGGMEGSMAGTGMRTFFTQVASEKKKIDALKKETGIDLSGMFDAKGEFKGYENALRIMEQFRKLSSQQRTTKLNDIFGERGGEVAGVMVDAGVEGWRSINAEAAKAVSVNEKINAQMETYNAKMEALYGTLENITAVSFTPMMNTVKPMLDTVNTIAGWTQEFAQAHPTIAGVTSEMIGLTGVSLTLVGGLGALRTAWGLWRIASAVGSADTAIIANLRGVATEAKTTAITLGATAAEVKVLKAEIAASSQMTLPYIMDPRSKTSTQGLLPFMYATETATNRVDVAMDRNAVKVSGFRNALSAASTKANGLVEQLTSLAATPAMKLTIGIAAVGAGVEIVKWMIEEIDKNKQRVAERQAVVTGGYDESLRHGKLFTTRTEAAKNKELLDTSARQAFELMRVLPSFQHGILPEYTQGGKFSINQTAGDIKQSNLALADPNILARLIRLLDKGHLTLEGGKTIAPDESQRIKEMLSSAYPEQFKVAMQTAAEDLAQSVSSLKEPLAGTINNFNELLHPTSKLPFQFGQVGDAASRLSNRLNNMQPNITFGTDTFFGNYRGGQPAPGSQSNQQFMFGSPSTKSGNSALDNIFKEHASLARPMNSVGSELLQASLAPRGGRITHITVKVDGANIKDADALAEKIAAKIDAVQARVDEHEETLYDWRHYDRMFVTAFKKGEAHA
ncbi:MAG: phage tail tape measure protein [Pyrinomonadaceae bacterium]